jgi:hypothetical protein
MKGGMENKTKKKKEKKDTKLQDLKPAKDPKGGIPPPCGPGGRAPVGGNIPAVQGPRGSN